MRSPQALLAATAGVLLAAAGLALAGAPAGAAVTYADTSLQASTPFSESHIALGTPVAFSNGFSLPVACSGIGSGTLAVNSDAVATAVLSGTSCGATLTVTFTTATPAPGDYSFRVTGAPAPAHNASDAAAVIVHVNSDSPSDPLTTVCVQNVRMTVPPDTVYPDIQFSATEVQDCRNYLGELPGYPATTAGFSLQPVNPATGLAADGPARELTASGSTLAPGTYSWVTVEGFAGSFSVASETFSLQVSGHAVRTPGPAGAISSQFSGKCLDVTGQSWYDGGRLQQWTCNGGADQDFQLVTSSGLTTLRALAPSGRPQGPWCVTARTGGTALPDPRQLVIETCGAPAGSQSVVRHGSFYEFPGTGLVMDDKGASRASGALVIGYPQKGSGTSNQRWSAP